MTATDSPIVPVTLARTGDTPVHFNGRLLAAADDPLPPFEKAKADSRRWHELRLYQTAAGKFVLAIGFRTGLETEQPRDIVYICRDRSEVEAILRNSEQVSSDQQYDPLQYLDGFPDLPKFADRQRKLEDRVTDDFDARVSKLFAALGWFDIVD